ncbi:hypothetical protein SEVIR_3G158800v4 [Setaria viridis]|uniref:Uncharacterized protein n=2 Tax=Setaria TaxID=4554 RepID=K3ZAZ5_SETIT|nr:hypothetical protein SETIT_3G155800v2 [Setaria italica]TKW26017.1 hypothetical protein SEVIR_3G158800v2 [Setaria viridis]
MAAVQELPLQVPRPIPNPRREGPSCFLALLGASLVVLFVVVKPPVHAGCALAGFLVWLMGMARLLLFGQIGRQRQVYPAALAAATAKLAVENFFGHQPPPESPAAQA